MLLKPTPNLQQKIWTRTHHIMIYNDNDMYMFDTNLKNKGFDPSNKFYLFRTHVVASRPLQLAQIESLYNVILYINQLVAVGAILRTNQSLVDIV